MSSPFAQVVAWSRGREGTCAVMLIAGVATFLTSFNALPPVALGAITAVWAALVVYFARSRSGKVGLTALSILIKSGTIALIVLVVVDPSSPVGPTNGLDWIPLGALNAGSGLWFLSLIQRRAQ
jgi:hypothetical protein